MNNHKKKITLALQGGGAHTAYIWGVVDHLLQKDDIEIAAVSGTSGGAMIAAVLTYGLSLEHDAEGRALNDSARRGITRELLDKFWTQVAALGDFYLNPYRFTANPFYRSWNIDGLPVPIALNALSLITSPYQSWAGPRQNPVALAIAVVGLLGTITALARMGSVLMTGGPARPALVARASMAVILLVYAAVAVRGLAKARRLS